MWNEARMKLTLENKKSLCMTLGEGAKETQTDSISASFSIRTTEPKIEVPFQEEDNVTVAMPATESAASSVIMPATESATALATKVASLCLQIHREAPWDTRCFAEEGVKLYFKPKEKPEKITAMYLFNPWWTRPAFVKNFDEIPEKTQVLFLKYSDYYTCILPLVGAKGKNVIGPGTKEEICFYHLGEKGMTCLEEDIFLWADGATLTEAVSLAFQALQEKEGYLPRKERKLPEMFHYLGWCSWDAFYKEISAEKLLEKAKEFKEKQIPVRWMLFDDGWMNAKEDMISDFLPDQVKFPKGFAGVIDEIRGLMEERDSFLNDQNVWGYDTKPNGQNELGYGTKPNDQNEVMTHISTAGKNSSIRWFGLWHAFAGYWAGVTPGSTLSEKEKDHLYLTRSGRLIPHPEKGEAFYRHWYQTLKEQKIDFVKVDGQSAGPFFFHDDLPLAQGVRGMHHQLEAATPVLDNQVINCMGMAIESMVSRKQSCVSRNSDDFCPQKENGFAEHLLQNAYNAIYHNEMYVLDWDMFWTTHEDAIKHAIIRAISGGPIYFSDKIGESNPKLVKKLVLSDGRILPMDRAAKPSADCLFTDPMKEGIFKLQNTAHFMENHIGGVLAVFNLTKETQSGTISPADIEGIEAAEEYWLYDFLRQEATLVRKDEKSKLTLDADGYAYYIILPKLDHPVSLGLVDKFTGFVATDPDGNPVEEGRCMWLG